MATTSLTTLGGARHELSDEALAEFRSRLGGEALTPADPGYEEVRAPFNAMHADRPSLIVCCTGTADVAEAVRFARQSGLEVTVRGAGTRSPGSRAATAGW